MSNLATITGKLTDLEDNAINGSVSVSLVYPNGSPISPNDLRLLGTAILGATSAVSTIAGTFSLTVLGNDVIEDLTGNFITYYEVSITPTGTNTPVWVGTYIFNSNQTYDLTSATPLTPVVPYPPVPSLVPANYVYAGPPAGANGPPSFRLLVAADIPGAEGGLGPVEVGEGTADVLMLTTLQGAGGGPADPQHVVGYAQVTISSVIYWVPLFQ